MICLRLLLVAAASMGWQLFADGPLAFYIAGGALTAWLALELAWRAPGRTWAVYACAAAHGITTTGCGAMYAAAADARHFLCDRGSGAPVSLISGLLLLAAAAYLLMGHRDG